MASSPSTTATGAVKFSVKTHLKNACKVENFNHIVPNPKIADLQLIDKADKVLFKFNNKNFGAFIDLPADKQYYNEYYTSFGKPYIYGLYNRNNVDKIDTIIGAMTLVYRYDHKIWQIMDFKIKKEFRGQHGVSAFVKGTLFKRIGKTTKYYGICMNNNAIIDDVIKKVMMPKMKFRGKMLIYQISFENMNKILDTLSTFYCSEIGFIDNNQSRIIVDSSNNRSIKLLHLSHNADYRQYDFHETQRGYQYCFSIYEDDEFIITELREKFKLSPSSSANVYSNDFKADWSKFVKTYEI